MMRTYPSRYQIGYRTPEGKLVPCHCCDNFNLAVRTNVFLMVRSWMQEGIDNGTIRQLGELTGKLDVGVWETGTQNFTCLGHVDIIRDEGSKQILVHFDQSFKLIEDFRATATGSAKGRKARQAKVLRDHLLLWDPDIRYKAVSVWLTIENTGEGKTFKVTLLKPLDDDEPVRSDLDEEQMICYLGQLLRRHTGG